MNTKSTRGRLSQAQWLDEGLNLLRDDPFERMTIDLLCKRLKRTKGSFYFHFANMESYLLALAAHWLEKFTLKFIAQSETRSTAHEKLDHLNTLAIKLDPRIEQGMRSLAAREPCIRDICTRVDNTRLAYLTKLYRATGKYSDDDAAALATIEYAAMVGYQQIAPNATITETLAMYKSFLKLTYRL